MENNLCTYLLLATGILLLATGVCGTTLTLLDLECVLLFENGRSETMNEHN